MCALELQSLVEQIHASGRQFVLSLTGGGSGAVAALLQAPGASASVLEVVVPYASKALGDRIGEPVAQYCSEKTARAMAMCAFERARELSSVDSRSLCGIGTTASLATNRPKRGPHRIHVAWQSATTTAVATCNFASGDGTRAEEELVATQMILEVVAEACGVACPLSHAGLDVEVVRRKEVASESWTELLIGRRNSVFIAADTADEPPAVLFPGAFNPPHWGHERMAQIASQRYDQPVTFELSITNVDKRPLDFIEIADRLERLSGQPVLMTRAPTFVEKSRLVPGCVFVVGVDTIQRIADPVYYGGSVAERDVAITAIAGLACRFLVFGRTLDGAFTTLSNVQIPASLRAICDEVPKSEFDAGVSSTELREKEHE